MTPKQLEKLKADAAIQILDQSGFNGGQAIVRIREGVPEFKAEQGYIPHFFHEYSVEVRDKNGKQVGETLFTAQTERDAIERAEEWKKSNKLKDGEKIYITPRGLARELGLDAEKLAPVIGDNDFAKMTQRIARLHNMTLEEAQALTKDAVQFKGRYRFLGNLVERKGAAGFVEDMDWVLRHYINLSTRYAAMESEFKPQAISLFEKLFGAFDDDYSRNPTAQRVSSLT